MAGKILYEQPPFFKILFISDKKLSLSETCSITWFVRTKSKKFDSKLVLLIWSLLGLIVGVFFVFISNAFQSQTASKKNKEF